MVGEDADLIQFKVTTTRKKGTITLEVENNEDNKIKIWADNGKAKEHANSWKKNYITMKTSTLILSLSALGFLSSCTYVAPRQPSSHTSSTTTSEVSPTTYGTVQTKTTRSY